jgi:formylglycine-generating enzyme required for sulfatase activity
VKANWKVCPVCEAPLGRLSCPRCGLQVKAHWKLCPECGAPLPPGEPAARGEPAPGDGQLAVEPFSGMEFIFVPAGEFDMGDLFEEGLQNETPVRKVRVGGFFMGRFAVTQGEWLKVMGSNPSHFKRGDRHPVEQVAWADVAEFIERLNERNRGRHVFRLPTEAEWEYAARSGGRMERYAGGNEADAVAWTAENSGGSTHPVGRKAPNGLGLYDMSGNVWEWCRDAYAAQRDAPLKPHNLPAPGGGPRMRVIRGGSWNLDAWSARCSRRYGFDEDYFGSGLGLRLVRTTG